EQISVALMAMAIEAQGHPAISFTGAQIGLVTDSVHTKARIKAIGTKRMKDELAKGKIVIVAGFQGVDAEDNITTLGRGGSDLTAVALAAVTKADTCEIYTDVDGVYTADPNIVKEARKLERISYGEMLELASLGAKVMQARSIEFAKKHDVPLVVRSSFNDNPGTLICKETRDMEDIVVSGAAIQKNEAKVTIRGVPDKPGQVAKIFGELAQRNLNVDMIVQNTSDGGKFTDVTFTVLRTDLKDAVKASEKLNAEIGGKGVTSDPTIAKVSVVGIGMRSHAGVASRMFSALADAKINIQMISTSEIKISCVIDEKHAEDALRAVHKAFQLGKA
ncbi:MAG: aspartate kinase, partial [Planctomycetes bacterium]|nr:aspartate kinase [Planctomycetota bacterium]